MTENGMQLMSLKQGALINSFARKDLSKLAHRLLIYLTSAMAAGGNRMKAIKLIDTETIETSNVFSFADGEVTVVEREVHEFYRLEEPSSPRLVIEDAIERTRNYISKSRAEFAELKSLRQ